MFVVFRQENKDMIFTWAAFGFEKYFFFVFVVWYRPSNGRVGTPVGPWIGWLGQCGGRTDGSSDGCSLERLVGTLSRTIGRTDGLLDGRSDGPVGSVDRSVRLDGQAADGRSVGHSHEVHLPGPPPKTSFCNFHIFR